MSRALPLPHDGAIKNIPSLCTFWNLNGIPCAACGLTRSFVCLAHGHLFESLRWHPLGPLLFGGALLYLGGTLLKWNFPRGKWIFAPLVVLFLVCWAFRLSGVFPLPVR